MTTIIKQRADKDCFLCCIAMAVGITYEEMTQRVGSEFVETVQAKGVLGRENVQQLFNSLGLEADKDYLTLFFMPESASVRFVKSVLWGRRALIQVRSKNYVNEMHIIYWDGDILHDPSNKRTYEWDEVEPIYLWLFKETKTI